MLKLGRKVEYGLMALLHIAEIPDDSLVPAREIAEAYSIPPEILGKVLQALKRAGIVMSTKGARGGYRLSRPLDRIAVGEVMEALDGPIQIAACNCYDLDHDCDQEKTCNIKNLVSQFRRQLHDFVYGMPLSVARTGLPNPGVTLLRKETVNAAVKS
jgi:Rrf2 family protein